ncbi:MAG: hypothetical protein H6574_01780 [Lewinellaceae bacterium]|nr:hypothetical protein [Saprospiraceae bacterium]MCB9329788.1 hypothetical protein [Lewinellaceae bacterium]
MPTVNYTFADFVAKFPPVSMPVTLGEDTHHVFSTENKPLPEEMIGKFIHPTEPGAVDDEFTEYMPCLAIDDTAGFVALIWWKAELLNYEYVLATFSPKGELIDRRVIAFTRVKDGAVHRAVATINDEWEIFVAEGHSSDGNNFDPTSSRMYDVEIMLDGTIVGASYSREV